MIVPGEQLPAQCQVGDREHTRSDRTLLHTREAGVLLAERNPNLDEFTPQYAVFATESFAP